MDNRLIQLKQRLTETTMSPGWADIKRFAETVVRDLEKKALAEEDDAKANGLRRNAKGARDFMEDLFHRIDLAKQINDEPTDESFLEVCY
jgi:hypothetical protein